jgi:hypothetical protein
MSIQKKILYVVVIILAIIGLLSIIPMPGNWRFSTSGAMEPIDDSEQVREGGGIPQAYGGGGGGFTVWEWTRPRLVPRLGEPEVVQWSSPYRVCAWGGQVCW